MLYLATATVHRSAYMGETEEEEVLRLVEASSETEAIAIVEKFYEQQSSEYSTTVCAVGVTVTPVLSKLDIR